MTHFTTYYPELRPAYEAMRELGLDESLLSFATLDPLLLHLSEPNGGVETDYLLELEQLLRIIKMPFESWPDRVSLAGTPLPTIVLKSDGLGYDWGNGLTSGWRRTPDPPGGWTQRPTDTVDDIHLASLACSDSYWDVMPDRFKTVSALKAWIPELFRIESVRDLPRNRKYLRERVWSVLAPSLALDARAALAMYRVMLPIDAKAAGRHLEEAESIAYNLGAAYFDDGFGEVPFGDEPILSKAIGRGIYDEGVRQSSEASLGQSELDVVALDVDVVANFSLES